ncbi:hypothetical protein ABB29_14780 [Pseudoxanthomonas dokdonensis]|uniref:Uncharacterized protein n=2 Tax=Pseudoxanthomonas dokdonensis TaxID=344882 RepID=A0A0R0CF36_9GAMM|nr:hypothetical protein ABB29_14780 [Pseudoxanthomonas dokdonensis]
MIFDDDDEVSQGWQRRLRELLCGQHDPLLRQALYRRVEQCIREHDDGGADHALHLRQFQLVYLLTAERGAAALS